MTVFGIELPFLILCLSVPLIALILLFLDKPKKDNDAQSPATSKH